MENDCETDVKDYGDNPPKDDTAVAAEMPMKGSTDNLVRRRKQKIQEHLAVTLDSPNTSQACLGPVMCDLLEWCQEGPRGPSMRNLPPARHRLLVSKS